MLQERKEKEEKKNPCVKIALKTSLLMQEEMFIFKKEAVAVDE